MAAVHAALDLGVDMVEVDVHRSMDGELVVIHDGTVTRTTNGTGAVNRFTLADLKSLMQDLGLTPHLRVNASRLYGRCSKLPKTGLLY